MTSSEIKQLAAIRAELCDLQRQNTLLQRCLAQVSADQVAMWELLRVVGALKKLKKLLDTTRKTRSILFLGPVTSADLTGPGIDPTSRDCTSPLAGYPSVKSEA